MILLCQLHFKCNRGIHESELTSICNITGEKHYRVHCRKCNSFGQWCIDNSKQELLNRWDKKLNNLDPFDVPYGSGKKYWFTCPVNNPNHPNAVMEGIVKQYLETAVPETKTDVKDTENTTDGTDNIEDAATEKSSKKA